MLVIRELLTVFKMRLDKSDISKRLEALKSTGFSLIAMDFDGTIVRKTPDDHGRAIQLMKQIVESGKIPAIITARDATFQLEFSPLIHELLTEISFGKAYVGTANGANLFKITPKGINSMHHYSLSEGEINKIVDRYVTFGFNRFCQDWYRWMAEAHPTQWGDIIAQDHLSISLSTPGVWVESAKVSVGLPEDEAIWEDTITTLKDFLGEEFNVASAGNTSIDITRRPKIDPKLHAVQEILKEECLNENEVITFGDSPQGNDKFLLSLPYSFTNRKKEEKYPHDIVPFSLHRQDVEAVHEAIGFLVG